MIKLAFGCSHTYGIGLADRKKAWPSLLGAINYGLPGGSSDYVARVCERKIVEHSAKVMYVFWPESTRFEDAGKQINPSSNPEAYRHKTDEWLIQNRENQIIKVEQICDKHNVLLVGLAMEDINGIIDHPDTWPPALDDLHFAEPWHEWMADLFRVREKYMRFVND